MLSPRLAKMLVGAERLLAHPRHAFAAHLGKAHRGAIHPDGHEVAANARHRPRAFGHFGAGSKLWAARENQGWRSASGQRQRLHGAVFGIQHGQVGIHAGGHIAGHAHFVQPFGHRAGNTMAGDRSALARSSVGAGVGHDHSAARPSGPLVELAQHMGRTSARQLYSSSFSWYPMTWRFSSTTRISRSPVANARGLGFQRPHHAHLVQAQADALAGGRVQPRSCSAWRVSL